MQSDILKQGMNSKWLLDRNVVSFFIHPKAFNIYLFRQLQRKEY